MGIQALSVRNRLRDKVIIDGPVFSEAGVETPAGLVASVSATRPVRGLGLAPGAGGATLAKAAEVSSAKR